LFRTIEKEIIIVFPAFNVAKAFEATIGEILENSYDEIILVDDAPHERMTETTQGLITYALRVMKQMKAMTQSEDMLCRSM